MEFIIGRSGERTLGSKLIRIADSREKKRATNNMVTLEVKRRVRLEGHELEQYLARKKEKEQEAARQRFAKLLKNLKDFQIGDCPPQCPN